MVYSFEFQTSQISETFESFSQFANKNDLVPILFIDTLDFLITDEHPIKQHKIGRFGIILNLAIESGVNIIFTTRTDEWNEYFANFSTGVKEHIRLSLPELMLPGVDSFYINEVECEHAEEFSQYTRVMQALLPILRILRNPTMKD